MKSTTPIRQLLENMQIRYTDCLREKRVALAAGKDSEADYHRGIQSEIEAVIGITKRAVVDDDKERNDHIEKIQSMTALLNLWAKGESAPSYLPELVEEAKKYISATSI